VDTTKLSSLEGTIAMVCVGIALAIPYVQAAAGEEEPVSDQVNTSRQLWNFALENGDGLGAGDPFRSNQGPLAFANIR
jgi:hypothetical protein